MRHTTNIFFINNWWWSKTTACTRMDSKPTDKNVNPRQNANIISILSFWWDITEDTYKLMNSLLLNKFKFLKSNTRQTGGSSSCSLLATKRNWKKVIYFLFWKRINVITWHNLSWNTGNLRLNDAKKEKMAPNHSYSKYSVDALVKSFSALVAVYFFKNASYGTLIVYVFYTEYNKLLETIETTEIV